ncbi:glycosyl hydrolase [uncultured Microbacterium sp.]|uniref:glycosyl hydrolase n=1 Tax=uncultured Microbacterium sp. TaxID=191216 RepID=UPI00262DAC41|nr:glycosyl hydrolase [uncultured Microbacterium sp.]
MRRAGSITAVVVVTILVATACAPAAPAPVATSRTDRAGVQELTIEQISTAPVVRLADGLVPPTSRWFSSLVFSADPQPVYPYPLAFGPRADGFTVQLPPVATTATTIAAPLTGGLPVGLGATQFSVTAYDPVSVTLQYADADGPLADVTIAEGAAAVAVRAVRETTLDVGAPVKGLTESAWSASIDGQEYGVLSPDASAEGSTITVPAGGWAQLYAVPAGGSATAWATALGDPVTGVTLAHSLDGDAARTRLTYDGAGATVLVPFAGREACAPDTKLGTFTTPYGDTTPCVAEALEWTVPAIEAASAYDLDGIDETRRAALVAQLSVDIGAVSPAPADTYFGGKSLARTAAMLSLAASLGEDELADLAADTLAGQLEPWLDPQACAAETERCFVYDDRLHLVVGKPAAFGAEDGNDHHFHYGYFLTAAAALASHRPDMTEELRPVMDALVADIAAGTGNGEVPPLRVFDPYRGHSWAAGLAPFSDGNNQESSSEAVAAWNGMAQWAEATGDATLGDDATWLLSAEADAATRLWLEPDTLPAGYGHSIVSLSWSDKRDYATWFSAEPSAILGIQLLPLGPVSLEYLADDPERVAANVADAGGGAAFAGPLGDSVAQYAALSGPEGLAAAESWAASVSRDDLDDGSSLSGVLAWLAAVNLRSD